MAYTQNSQSGKTIQKQIKELTFSTSADGATEAITFPANSMVAPIAKSEAITTPNAHSEVGQQVGSTNMIDFTAIGLGEIADWTALNELKDQGNVCSYVKIEYMEGPAEEWKSNAVGVAIVYISVGTTNESDGTLTAQIHCERITPNIAKTIS